ncbi:MAG: DNA gyrase inhibitor YacG [Planctomycetota bacterium]
MKHRCPTCKKVFFYNRKTSKEHRSYFPFCSDRCKLIDLGNWLDSRYTIPADEQQETRDKQDPD